MDISKYKLYKNGTYTYLYNGFISVVSCLIKYSVITSKKAEKYRLSTIFKIKTGKLHHRNTVGRIQQLILFPQ